MPGLSAQKFPFDGNSLLGGLPAADLERLLTYARTKRYRQNETIFLKDAPGSSMMAVTSGYVRITAPSPDGKDVTLNVIGPGEVFGEIALIDGKPRTADAVALTDCQLLVLERRDFIPFLRERPDICIRLLTIVCERLRRTSAQVEDVLFLDIGGRLARTLLYLASIHGQRASDGVRIGIRLSQREIASMAGSSRETVNRQLQAWQREGLLRIDDAAIVLRDEKALRRLADGL
ncbi:MAG TPA: Crp/Fnr family transcriptional regulator [Alphaproteobacteria bacterium]